MKTFTTALAALLITFNASAQNKSSVYPLVVMFNSECCGVPSNKPLLKYIATFKKTCNIKKLSACRIGPMGREGEYYLAFRLKELNKRQTTAFIKGVKTVVKKMKDKGSATIEEQYNIAETGKECEMQKL
ncbi:MAG: hypothetical protein WKF88_02555 [Ferruginibacter sp.]